jgi:hypothetical protein
MTSTARALAPSRLCFGQGYEFRALAEIFLSRRLDAIGARAEIDAIEVQFENLVLGVFSLEPERENSLLDFARERAFLSQKQIFGELLRECRSALHAMAPDNVSRYGAHDADRIDAEMRIEAPVFDGDESLGQIGRQFA